MTVDEQTKTHAFPLDPLSSEEISAAVELLRQQRGLEDRHRVAATVLREPPKDQVLAVDRGDVPAAALDRQALVVIIDTKTSETYEAVISLTQGEVVSWTHVPEVQAAIMPDEFDDCVRICRESEEYREALRKRGITDLDQLVIDPWSAGYYGDDEGGRLLRALSWVRSEEGDNAYAHPIDNVVAIVDLAKSEVRRVEDYGVVPVPQERGNYAAQSVGPLRDDLTPLEISQPSGPSFEVDGHLIQWQKWQFRIGFTPKEGLVLRTVSFLDQGRRRPVLYRAALSEMVVPYGDPSPSQWRKNAFDAGEYNIGALANSLELGCDCLGEIRYFDAGFADSRGRPVTVRNAICLHEEDAGLLWKHYDWASGQAEVRRSRRLVVSFIATVANYEYAFYWHFYQDGVIEFRVKMTGIVSTAALPAGEKTKYGQVLNKYGLYAPIHQHLFNVRMDVDVDGPRNAVYEVHTEAPDVSEENPNGNVFYTVDSLLESEQDAQQLLDPSRSRYWKIVNHERRNAAGEPVAYRLMPLTNTRMYAQPESWVAKRAAFARKHLWVTQYDESERHASGDYPNQSRGGSGLEEWTARDRSLVEEDVVLWYTVGSDHPVRLEDWPVMPVQHVGFMLQPFGFFDRNPALDVPPPESNGHCSAD